VEATLLAPWVLFLAVGTLDMGFFAHALIAVENAVRVGGEYTAQGSAFAANQSGACTKVLAELASLPNVAGLTTCSAAPVIVTATSVTGPDGSPATTVSVTYRTVALIPIPGLLTRQLNFTRSVTMRVKT
jgi:hypothetical protein